MKYKAIIFDLDGVICHSDKYHYLAWKEVADEIGVHFDESVNNRLRGVSREKSLDIILESFKGDIPQEQRQNYAVKKNVLYCRLLESFSPVDLSADVKKTMDTLKVMGLKLAIGSSSKNARLILKQLGLQDYFDAVSDGTNITHSKPHPEVFLKAAELLKVAPEECIVVEDADTGIEAAKAANMDTAAIGSGVNRDAASYYLSNFSDLLSIV